MWACKHCEQEFDFNTTSEKGNHSRWCDSNPMRNNTAGIAEGLGRFYDEQLGKIIKFEVSCSGCDAMFIVEEREKQFPLKEDYYCSRVCANSVGGKAKAEKMENPHYRTICFKYHEKKCIICGEDIAMSVHHADYNHDNDDPENLIPMCMNHHHYMHSRHRVLIEDQVKEYIDGRM